MYTISKVPELLKSVLELCNSIKETLDRTLKQTIYPEIPDGTLDENGIITWEIPSIVNSKRKVWLYISALKGTAAVDTIQPICASNTSIGIISGAGILIEELSPIKIHNLKSSYLVTDLKQIEDMVKAIKEYLAVPEEDLVEV